MELNKINTALSYEFILIHKDLKQYYENYFKYKDSLNNKYDLYTLVYINELTHKYKNDENNELYIYLGITNDLKHMFILCDIQVGLVFNPYSINDIDINKDYIINKINVPEEIYQKYIDCLTKTYDIVGRL